MPSSNTQPQESIEVSTVSVSEKPSWQIKLLYDGECPLCVREVNFLRKRDAGRGKVTFVDIADDDYTPSSHGGVDFETAMGRIHAVLPDGTVIKNVEVFRRVYEILGMGWIYAATKLPVIGWIVDTLYEIWADWRLALTGRPDLKSIISDRQKRIECKTLDRCRLTDDKD
jgi:predicted DCC family thiol-disulfide oxidoreductase YuxK